MTALAAAVGGPEPVADREAATAELAVRGLTKSFAGGPPVVRGVDLSVLRGESVALIGANGAGKSTLFRCCVRLVEPDAGSIELFGKSIDAVPRRELSHRRADIGFVFQRHNLVPRLCALSNVMHGMLGRRRGPRYWVQSLSPAEARDKAMACLEQVRLGSLAGQRADSLSGGQSQRVAIARALMQDPRLIMADEPVASLDPVAGEEVMELFVGLIREAGLTLFFISHNLDHALRYGDRVIAMRDGEIALDAPSRDLDAADLRRVYD